uniref:Reverse transcriptase Ty1/copia-type domain-containing protein n=1 Tax=Amphimedon queenslandica TaxID=400682 RepID=A0A1X7TA35_AMPQE
MIAALAAQNNLQLHQMYVKTDSLNGELKRNSLHEATRRVWRERQKNLVIKCSIRGLKQSSHYWNFMLDSQLKKMQFAQSNSDP